MKHGIATVIFFLSLSFTFAQTQGGMNSDADKEYQAADKELNTAYQKILTEYKSDASFITNLKAAQRLWIQFRDAEVKARYPKRKDGEYGSAQPTCVSQYMTELTQQRIKTLNVWLTGIEEGDVCSGSVKMKQ